MASSSSGVDPQHIDHIYRSQKSIDKGLQAANDCGTKEGKTGAVAGAVLGATIGVGIPPGGVWVLLTAPLGALIGWIVGEVAHNERNNNNKD